MHFLALFRSTNVHIVVFMHTFLHILGPTWVGHFKSLFQRWLRQFSKAFPSSGPQVCCMPK